MTPTACKAGEKTKVKCPCNRIRCSNRPDPQSKQERRRRNPSSTRRENHPRKAPARSSPSAAGRRAHREARHSDAQRRAPTLSASAAGFAPPPSESDRSSSPGRSGPVVPARPCFRAAATTGCGRRLGRGQRLGRGPSF